MVVVVVEILTVKVEGERVSSGNKQQVRHT